MTNKKIDELWAAMNDPNADKSAIRSQLNQISAQKASPIIGKTIGIKDLKDTSAANSTPKQSVLPTPKTSSTYNPNLFGERGRALMDGTAFDKEHAQKLATTPSLPERAGRTVLGAAENFIGSAVNAIDVTSQSPVLNPVMYIANKYNNLFVPNALDKTADALDKYAESNFTRAKEGASKAGKLAVDVGAGAVQLAGDIGIAAATGGSALIPMAVRSFGGAAQEAENAGAGLGKQIAYGGLSAATSLLTEKLSNVGSVLSKTYGKGVLDDTLKKATSSAISKLIKNGVISDKVATMIVAGAGEGLEEMLESALSPIYKRLTYDKNAKWDAEEVLYNGLVGAILGGAAGGIGGTNVNTAQNQTINVQDNTITPVLPKTVDDHIEKKANVNAKVTADIQTADIPSEAAQSPVITVKPNKVTDTEKAVKFSTAQNSALKTQIPSVFPKNSLGAKITQKSELPQGLGAASNTFVPEQKLSKVYSNTFQKTDALTDNQRAQMKADDYMYDVRSHAMNETAAQQRVDVDYKGEIADLYNKQEWTDEDVFTSKKILDKISADAEQSGDFTELNKWTKAIQERGTRGGQTVEAFKAFQKTPEGAVIKAQQVIAEAEKKLTTKKELGKNIKNSVSRSISSDIENTTKIVNAIVNGDDITGMSKELKKVTIKDIKELVADGKYDADAINELVLSKYGIPTLTAADVQKIYEFSKLAQEQKDDYFKRLYEHKAAKVVADKLPVTGKDKVLAIRRIAMLLNPKTLISRNAGGNVIFGLLEDVKDMPATLIDIAVSKKTGQRTTSFNLPATAKAETQGFKKGIVEWGKDIKYKVDTSPTQHEMPQTPTFKSNIGKATEEALNKLLQLGDRPFYEAAYAKRIDELKRLGYDVTSEDAIAQARVYALERVFQNNSELAKRAMELRDSLDVLGDITIPFAQTPANIFDKLADYSPYGFVRAIKKAGAINDSSWSQKQFVDTLSRALTGTGIITFAFFAAKNGLITGGEDKDEDEGLTYLNKVSGWQPYSIRVGDTTYTYDWATVAGALLALGADMAQSQNGGDTLMAILSSGAKAGINTMFNQSYMEGIAELFSKSSGGEQDIASGLEALLVGLPASFTPTAFQQIAKIIDPIARDTYDTDPFKKSWNKVKAKVPFLSRTLPSKIGANGQEMTNFQGGTLSNIFESMLSPGYIGRNQKTAIDSELERLYNATGDNDVLPNWSEYTSKSDLSIEYQKQKYALTTKEFADYQQSRGKLTYNLIQKVIKTSAYTNMSDEQKASVISEIIGYANDIAKREYLSKKGVKYVSNRYEKIYRAAQSGISPSDYFIFKAKVNALDEENGAHTQYEAIKELGKMGFSDKQQIAMIASLYTSYNDEGDVSQESLLPYLSTSSHLLALYNTSKGQSAAMINMTVPKSFVSKGTTYELTDEEKKLYKEKYVEYFNLNVNNLSTERNIKYYSEKAAEKAKQAIINKRKREGGNK